MQLSVGQEGGAEAAVHAMRDLYDDENTEGLLFVDADNTFNNMNRYVTLHNCQRICPIISVYLINTYRAPCKLFVQGGSTSQDNFIWSNEGTTQGDNLASLFYSLGTHPLIFHLHQLTDCEQIWFADDSGAGGVLPELRKWWDELNDIDPSYGYFPKPSKCWLITKPHKLNEARQIFSNCGVNITDQGHESYLGSPIGTDEFMRKVIEEKVDTWVEDLKKITTISKIEPQ